jgi:hypothetical protein
LKHHIQLGAGESILILVGNGKAFTVCSSQELKHIAQLNGISRQNLVRRLLTTVWTEQETPTKDGEKRPASNTRKVLPLQVLSGKGKETLLEPEKES